MVQKGDYILLEYTVTSKDDGKVVETTVEDTAKQANIYNPDEVYGPRLIIVGETKLFEPLEQALLAADEGGEVNVEVPPDKAFGERDQGKVKTLSIREFYKYGKIPKPGDVVEMDGQQARVISISSGRAILDFNHPLAGKALIIKGRIVRKLVTDEEKAKQIVKIYLPRVEGGDVEVSVDRTAKSVTVKLPPSTLFIDKIGNVKLRIAEDLAEKFGAEKVQFIEEITIKREEQKREGEQQQQPQQQAQAQQGQQEGGVQSAQA